MKKSIYILSIVTSSVLLANEVEVPTVNISEKVNTKVIKSISDNEMEESIFVDEEL